MRGFSGGRASLLVTVALATLGAACKSKSSSSRDAAGSADAGADAAVGAEAGMGAEAGVDVAADAAPGDSALADALRADSAPDATADRPAPDAAPDAGALDAAAANPRRLWFSGPEDSIHLAEVEPDTPF
jgi:hypothetical protein